MGVSHGRLSAGRQVNDEKQGWVRICQRGQGVGAGRGVTGRAGLEL